MNHGIPEASEDTESIFRAIQALRGLRDSENHKASELADADRILKRVSELDAASLGDLWGTRS